MSVLEGLTAIVVVVGVVLSAVVLALLIRTRNAPAIDQ